jgi:hypothetical protein
MVTRNIELATFVPIPRVPFAVVSQLAAVLKPGSTVGFERAPRPARRQAVDLKLVSSRKKD